MTFRNTFHALLDTFDQLSQKSQTSTLVHRDFLFSPPKEGKKQQERKKEKVSNLQLHPNCKA